jgi:N-acetylmuramoyl-L-alanine amidase
VVLDLAVVPADNEYVVAIDPGHGGRAPGAVGKGGTLEKNVVLGICQQLAKSLNARPGVRAILTRNNDKTLSLGERVEIARDENADLFVSVHADAITDRRVRGGSVYALSNTGAEHAARRWAGKIPDRAKTKTKLAGVDLSHRDATVANVLYDLVQNDTLERSNLLAEDVLSHMQDTQRVRFDKVRLADLGVLKAPDIPSILVETAFISNVQDEKLLKSAKGQRSLAQAIARGISGFIERPSEIARVRSGTSDQPLIAAAAPFRHYAVAKGDTLYSLARRFGVSVKTLTDTNRLQGTTIKYGMTLRVPGVATVVAAGN